MSVNFTRPAAATRQSGAPAAARQQQQAQQRVQETIVDEEEEVVGGGEEEGRHQVVVSSVPFLEDMDDDVDPNASKSFLPGPEALKDGDYDFEVVGGDFKFVDTKNLAIVETVLEVIGKGPSAGKRIANSWFIKDRDSANRCLGELKSLGFDVDEWTKANGRPFSSEIQKAPKAMVGIRFRATKVTSKNGKFGNLNKIARLPNDGKPEVIGPEELNAFNSDSPF